MHHDDKELKRENAIRRLFAEGLRCGRDNLQNSKSSTLGRWGDPAGIAIASFFKCWDYEDCLELKFVVGFTVLVAKNVVEHCQKDLKKLLGITPEEAIKDLENMLVQLESYKCDEDCSKILHILDDIIDKYIFPKEFYKNEAVSILDCCS